MNNRLYCVLVVRLLGIKAARAFLPAAVLAICTLAASQPASCGDAPQWMHALVNVPVPSHDEKTDAVLLYSEDTLIVQGNGKIKNTKRRVYKILRPGGKRFGTVRADFDSETKINSIHGWCIPAQGKDYEIKDKDAIETALFGVQDGELMSDLKTKLLTIPAADLGNIVGYEIDQEVRPYVLQDVWEFQEVNVPVREARYTLQLPPGWEYKAAWLNHAPVTPTSGGANQWQWVLSDVGAIKPEYNMPPRAGVVGQMIVSLLPQGGGQNRGFVDWNDMGRWEDRLAQGRRDASAEIKQKVAALTGSSSTNLARCSPLAHLSKRKFYMTQFNWESAAGSRIRQPRYSFTITAIIRTRRR